MSAALRFPKNRFLVKNLSPNFTHKLCSTDEVWVYFHSYRHPLTIHIWFCKRYFFTLSTLVIFLLTSSFLHSQQFHLSWAKLVDVQIFQHILLHYPWMLRVNSGFIVWPGWCLQSLAVVKKLQPKRAFLVGMTHEFEHELDNKILAEWSLRYLHSFQFTSKCTKHWL